MESSPKSSSQNQVEDSSTSRPSDPQFPGYQDTVLQHDDDDDDWIGLECNLVHMGTIIEDHFGMPCVFAGELGRGAYARCRRYTLVSGLELAVRLILPVRESVKTEVEVATMTYLRGKWRERLVFGI